jgi:nucleotide sugar dehydrogenase
MSHKIGIVGGGFVGGAMYANFKGIFDVHVWDLNEEKRTIATFESFVEWSDIIFVCVPTPMNEDGSCNTSIVESVVQQIASLDRSKHVVIKSTVPPGTTQRLAQDNGMAIAFNPEFLTEANAVSDFRHQPLIIVGADEKEIADKVWGVYYHYVNKTGYMPNMIGVKTAEAEMFKYMANSFLALKVVFANEIKMLCDKVGIEYSNVANIAKNDRRLGQSHWQVPGPDGKLGYGGSCFPKDTNALIHFADSNDIMLWLLTEASYINDEIRHGERFDKFAVISGSKKDMA